MVEPPKRSIDFFHYEEVTDGINVIVDDRFCALFPMESYPQVLHLVESANLAFRQREAQGRIRNGEADESR